LGEEFWENRTVFRRPTAAQGQRTSRKREADAFSFSGAVLPAFCASLLASVSLGGAWSLLVRSGAVHLAIDESAQNNYERRCI
jgi:hypothetical protein